MTAGNTACNVNAEESGTRTKLQHPGVRGQMKTCDQLARREEQAAERIEQQEGELMRIRAASFEVVPNLAPPVRRHK
jgi:hypothetical protein